MKSFTEYILNEKFAPLASLVRDENNMRMLMKMGVNERSKLVLIPKSEAIENEKNLILFSNYSMSQLTDLAKGIDADKLVTDKPEFQKHKLIADVKKTKAREVLLKKKNVPSVWIGFKNGNQFAVWRPLEAGGGKKKSCNTIECLYDSKYAYKVVNTAREEATRKFREENPDRKDWASGKNISMTTGNLAKKMYKIKLTSLLDKVLTKLNKDIINSFEKNYEENIKKKDIENSDFGGWSDGIPSSEIDMVISLMNDIEKKDFDKKKIEGTMRDIERKIS